MSKIIIHNLHPEKISDSLAIAKVSTVINGGKISNNNSQYCYLTVFTDGITVSCIRSGERHTFKVYMEQD